MSEQIWTIELCISGAFFLTKAEELNSATPAHPQVRKILILPEFDEKNNQVGIFNIKIDFCVETENEEKLEGYIIADLARDIIDYYINLLTFLTGSEIKKIKPTNLKYEYPEGGKFRSIFFESEHANLIPPVPLMHTYLFKSPLDEKIARCLAFYTYGIKEKDIIISTYFLLSALDMIAVQFKIDSKRTRECQNCGFTKEIEPGSAERIKYVMTNIANFSEEEFKKIWGMRNSIFHGYFSITAKNVREILDKRTIVRITLIKAIKNLMNLKDSDLPLEHDPNWFSDPFLDVEHVSKS